MDPRHQLSKTLDKLAVDPAVAANMSARTDAEAEQAQASSGVTIEGLRRKIGEQLEATYVEIEDMSGKTSHIFAQYFEARFSFFYVVYV